MALEFDFTDAFGDVWPNAYAKIVQTTEAVVDGVGSAVIYVYKDKGSADRRGRVLGTLFYHKGGDEFAKMYVAALDGKRNMAASWYDVARAEDPQHGAMAKAETDGKAEAATVFAEAKDV